MTGYTRGERQALRTRRAIVNAFSALIREKNYADITVNDIIGRADAGRSTFYRYFRTKADLLIYLHEERFDNLLGSLSSASAWMSASPPPELQRFLEMFRELGKNRQFSLAYMLGNDIDYVIHHINRLLSAKFEKSLYTAFGEEKTGIPIAILARSVAGSYCWIVISWLTGEIRGDADAVAAWIHRLARASVREALIP